MRYAFICLALLLTLSGCGHYHSIINQVQTTLGAVERRVTLYDSNGKVIKTWTTSNAIESYGPTGIAFVDTDKIHVRITGIIVIEQYVREEPKKEVKVFPAEEIDYYKSNN
jgi:uncharacterized protein YceK